MSEEYQEEIKREYDPNRITTIRLREKIKKRLRRFQQGDRETFESIIIRFMRGAE